MTLTELVEDYLLAWVLLAVVVGVLVPAVAVVTRAATPILAVMVGSVSLTLSRSRFREIEVRALVVTLCGHLAMPLVAYAIARVAGLSPALTVGFVLLGAVTPELVTPTMTELAGGDTALSSVVLVAAGLGSTVVVPGATALVDGAASVATWPIVEQLLLAVVAPMALAIAVRALFPARVARHDETYPAVSAVMVVLVIGGVTGANAGLLRGDPATLAFVGATALALNVTGYALGWLVTAGTARAARIAGSLSVGMRDFAVAAALVVTAGFPPEAALPAVAFGVIEMATSAAIAQRV
ncbi:bile acid:sodium symporter family protein [Haloarcula salina]|uniref:Na+-dependent transporter n=1 Tax=Haloarcula salina TaxID=1429914 RepID=A0AA41KFP3_9EURY|nr:Na+-dependent transporter [Haloarcula salina]MBV0902247.1 Na+-dependent transporter [Haloarcula salina]